MFKERDRTQDAVDLLIKDNLQNRADYPVQAYKDAKKGLTSIYNAFSVQDFITDNCYVKVNTLQNKDYSKIIEELIYFWGPKETLLIFPRLSDYPTLEWKFPNQYTPLTLNKIRNRIGGLRLIIVHEYSKMSGSSKNRIFWLSLQEFLTTDAPDKFVILCLG